MKIPEYTRSVYRILKITTFYNNQYTRLIKRMHLIIEIEKKRVLHVINE